MGEVAKRIATYADIEALPPNLVGEIIDGELHTMSRPSPRHARAHLRLATWSSASFDRGNGALDGWWIFSEPEIHLRNDVVVPDIAGWRKSSMRELPETAFFTQPPDWICEVLSPSTQSFDRARKMSLYARERVAYAWLLDPLARLLEAFELSGDVWTRFAVHEGSEVVRVKPFEASALDLGDLWSGVAVV